MSEERRLVRLLIDHPHGGKTYRTGTKLLVSNALAKWWIAQGVARSDVAGAAKPKPRESVSRGGCCGRSWPAK